MQMIVLENQTKEYNKKFLERMQLQRYLCDFADMEYMAYVFKMNESDLFEFFLDWDNLSNEATAEA